MSGGDWLRPDWFRSAMRAWTPAAMVPAPVAAAMRQVVEQFGLAPAMVGKQLIDSAASRLVGREATIHAGDTEVTLVLRRLRLVRPPVGLMIGQVGDVEIEAEDVATGALRVRGLHLDVRNLHVQPGATATVVAAPIRVRAVIDGAVLLEALAERTRRVEIELGADGTARAYLAGRRTWGHVELVPHFERGALVLAPTRIVLRDRDVLSSLARRVPPLRLVMPELAAGLHIVGVAVEDGGLVVDAVYEEWRREVTPEDVEQLLRRIERFDGGVLDVRPSG
jgi:hypothetical protein